MNHKQIALILTFLVLAFVICRMPYLISYEEDRFLNGVYMPNRSTNEMAVLREANTLDSGDWVCVNIKEMSYQQAFDTCAHEVGHEIFAEYCEDNIEECINLTEV